MNTAKSLPEYFFTNWLAKATKIEYWYGEEEKRAREKEHDIELVNKAFPQTVFKEFKGLAHAELVMMFPERFAAEVKKFLEE